MDSQDTVSLTPRQIVERLDQYIVGQNGAKKSVAVALRNRYRRMMMDDALRDEIIPKNILMIGPTGVGKTEIARRIAKIVRAPFTKVEATKFTEVGYVGRDVESMVRDLVEVSVRLVKEEKMQLVRYKAEENAEKRIVKLLAPAVKKKQQTSQNPFEALFQGAASSQDEQEVVDDELKEKRNKLEYRIKNGELDSEIVTIEVTEQQNQMFDMFKGSGMDQMAGMQDAFSGLFPKKKKKRKVTVGEAKKILFEDEATKLIDQEEVSSEGIRRAEQMGIIFIDEIDKVASQSGNGNAQVSREGVQRDILPIVEGSQIATKYGTVNTEYILFIAAGAFHISKPSDLIPELQGRFPIRVELEKLSQEDFIKILTEPDNALIKQYKALLKAENIDLIFTKEAVERMAEIAFQVNQESDNIGARRLHTILEKLLEDLLFEAPEITLESVTVTENYVNEKLETIMQNKDLTQFIL
ncbi:ATP-dependent protease ATPase subunit HslU [Listeria fleischmannii]|jgi:ATP-dependent HslUV protease ATP-binding subunit HslU|uniref:ATP-dependent protease ATPase subunit HslU n=1 Tax=Listeria fleischmannii TaxID=1069827 RepID=A0A841YB26_9LIST|nr:ATP-dependent protease ATPase subunit HslU [Listeria fleischmannii]EIA20820.1 ATP-dependent protease ATP-binding subunit HslU [Listeria fleischmannii subsp. coloradonensis]MBC1397428.1 ATP-dependent protease ATPase subunit HslU [Listeria fleischmannii]MBC1418435.1 ATP-dependent protease ATPase subunit HslU [Listeria fleischmannii]MBC1425797.1 ATP-dependent protease ATPase subunit HslU [Listeria fleischmannii]STY35192.1 ATP-dependent protease ATPase subunit ClpY [Listeria fleischmannii subsp